MVCMSISPATQGTIVTAIFFLKTNFPGLTIGRLWRVITKQCASDLCDVFAGLLIDASTSRGNFYWIWLEVSLYHVYHRKLSLVTFQNHDVQRITDGNLLSRTSAEGWIFFVRSLDCPHLCFYKFRLACTKIIVEFFLQISQAYHDCFWIYEFLHGCLRVSVFNFWFLDS